MKRVTAILLGAFLTLSIASGLALAAEKFAYVDLSKTFSEYGKTKDYDKVLGEKEEAYTTEREKKVDEIKKLQDKINLLSDKEKEAQRPDLEEKANSLQNYDRQQQTDLRKEQDERMKELMKDIEEAISKYAKKEGYTFVFNDRVLVYQDKGFDITDQVIDILNKGYKKR
ncbi:MAG: OmpH family outer membrane protein [Candidatus Omnitrophota bacterium]